MPLIAIPLIPFCLFGLVVAIVLDATSRES